MSEFIGVIIGDGNLWGAHYEIVVTGDVKKDQSYFEFLANIIKEKFDYSPVIRFRGGGLRLVIRSKKIFGFLEKFFPDGKTAETVRIPDGVRLKSVLRGIFDTDGTIFFSSKPGVEQYPTIEITTISPILAKQIKKCLAKLGFRPRIRCFKEIHDTFKVSLHGKKQIIRWLKTIGSSNENKLAKLKLTSQAA